MWNKTFLLGLLALGVATSNSPSHALGISVEGEMFKNTERPQPEYYKGTQVLAVLRTEVNHQFGEELIFEPGIGLVHGSDPSIREENGGLNTGYAKIKLLAHITHDVYLSTEWLTSFGDYNLSSKKIEWHYKPEIFLMFGQSSFQASEYPILDAKGLGLSMRVNF